MLVELSIENLGIIESSRLTFDSGFTAFTGETGAGKTMLVEAIGLVVGQRADVGGTRHHLAGADPAESHRQCARRHAQRWQTHHSNLGHHFRRALLQGPRRHETR